MSIDVTITGNGDFVSLEGYSVSEDSTPTVISDSSGSVGSIGFDAREVVTDDKSLLLRGDTLTLKDSQRGTTVGTITGVSITDGAISVSADSRLVLLNSIVTIQPRSTTVQTLISDTMALIGLSSDSFTIASGVSNASIRVLFYSGDAWTWLKELSVVYGFEIALVAGVITFRNIRGTELTILGATSSGRSVGDADRAQRIQVTWHETSQITSGLIYPFPELAVADQTTMSVGSGQTQEYSIDTGVSLSSIQQPVAVNSDSEWRAAAYSAYTVSRGIDGQLILADQWKFIGGTVSVSMDDNASTLRVKVSLPSGPYADLNGPFTIGEIGDYVSGNSYNTLKIYGTGVKDTPHTIDVYTGYTATQSPQDIGVTINSPHVQSLSQAWQVGLPAAKTYVGVSQTVSFEEGRITSDSEQEFGNVAGARLKYGYAYYRLRGASVGPESVSGNGEWDTLYSDFNSVWSGKTYADLNTKFTGKTYDDLAMIPLWQ